MDIKSMSIAEVQDGNELLKRVKMLVAAAENEGYDVEIQHSSNESAFSAMVIGRSKYEVGK